MNNFGIYGIISNPVLPHETVAEIFVSEQIKYIQLREKHLSDRDLFNKAQAIQKIVEGSTSFFLINDRPDIALMVNANGVHIGQDDLPYPNVRKLLGEDAIIGISTHNLLQLENALLLKPNYVGFGPVYATTTKENPDPVVGTSMLKIAIERTTIPLVAIGGIFPENLDEVLKTGAKNICLVRYFMQAETKKELIQRIKIIKHKLMSYDTDASSH